VDRHGIGLITGHFPLEKYVDVFDKGMFVCFVRDPVQRIISEYKYHLRKAKNFNMPVDAFYKLEANRNTQARMLGGLEGARSIGFVGVTEEYERSLGVLNRKFDLSVSLLHLNVGRERGDLTELPAADGGFATRLLRSFSHGLSRLGTRVHQTMHPVSEEMALEIRTLNQQDLEIYQFAKTALLEFPADPPRSDPPVAKIRGRIGGLDGRILLGWAADHEQETPVRIDVLVNGHLTAHVWASEFRAGLRERGIKRSGCCGFRVPMEGLSPGDSIRCLVSGSTIELANSPLIVPAEPLGEAR
jgi:hypothetical protein